MDKYRIICELIFCTFATLFSSLLMSAPLKTVPASALLAGAAYTVYKIIIALGEPEFFSYFIATLLIAVISEILARIYKMPATIFIFPSMIPLVPGTGLYKSMLCLVERDYVNFSTVATQTLFAFSAITVALALTGVIARSISAYFQAHKKKRRSKPPKPPKPPKKTKNSKKPKIPKQKQPKQTKRLKRGEKYEK